MNIRTRQLMRGSLPTLRDKARCFGLDSDGTREQLAMRIAEYEEERFEREWKTISGGKLPQDILKEMKR
jgi:hypothetical protein